MEAAAEETGPAIAVLPYGIGLGARPGRFELERMDWPLGMPARLRGKHLRDLAPTDHLLLDARRSFHFRPFGTRARVSFMVQEPTPIHGYHFKYLRRTHWRYFRIFSHNEAFLASIPNGVFMPYGTTWVGNWAELDLRKARMTSLIASAKRSQPGHMIRHSVARWARETRPEVDVMGRGYAPFEAKSDGLAPYRYSVVIENVREPNYFSEKLLDALLCETVPIYWGCPNISRFLPTESMVICETEADIRAAVRAASPEDYQARRPALLAAREAALAYQSYVGRIAEVLLAAP